MALASLGSLLLILLNLCTASGSLELYSVEECPTQFEEKCMCGYKSVERGSLVSQYVTNCTDSDFTDASMLRYMPINTEILIFTGNRIPDLPLNVFGKNQSFDILDKIDMSGNHIQTIKGKTFHGVNSVRTIILDDNDLYIVSKDHHPRVFSNFLSLETLSLRNAFTEKIRDYSLNLYDIFVESDLLSLKNLYLDYNEIKSVNDEMFCPMKRLRRLYLGGNMLRGLSFNISCLPHLQQLDLGDNLIPYLMPSSIQQLQDVPGLQLNLTGNPFQCDCHMYESGTFNLLHQSNRFNIIDKNTFHCSNGDPENIGKPLFTVLLSICPVKPSHPYTRITSTAHHSNAGIIVLTVIIILMCALLAGSAYMHRASLSVWVTETIARVKPNGRYASLDKQEEEKEMEV